MDDGKMKVVSALEQLEAQGIELLQTRAEAADQQYQIALQTLNQANLSFAAGLLSFGMAYLRNKADDQQRALEELEGG